MKTNFKKDLKTIIKQILLEIGLQGMIQLSNFDREIQNKMLGAIEPYKETDPEKYKKLKKLIDQDVVEELLNKVDDANKQTGVLPPAARTPAQRAEMRKWNR
jgi:hypothetical protein